MLFVLLGEGCFWVGGKGGGGGVGWLVGSLVGWSVGSLDFCFFLCFQTILKGKTVVLKHLGLRQMLSCLHGSCELLLDRSVFYNSLEAKPA